MTEHPITPPPALIEGWVSDFFGAPLTPGEGSIDLATRAAQWGADQELEACCLWLEKNVGRWEIPLELRDARRPKPPSLKEQALLVLDDANLDAAHHNILLRALEQLDD
jgi:hypothetical protein